MASVIGNKLKLTIFGQSHSEAIGMTLDGFPAGKMISTDKIICELNRRAPGRTKYSSSRTELDLPRFISGLIDGISCGAPITALIENMNYNTDDYKTIKNCPRPGHSDFPAWIKYGGFNDQSGGGHFSGRLTAPIVIAGSICNQLIEDLGITIKSSVTEIYGISESYQLMMAEIDKARADGDSVGGIVSVEVKGLPVGLGENMFGSIESRLSQGIFGIPAIKGIEFGKGFGCARLRGSDNNDEFYLDGDVVKTKTNNSGGILGGLATGMPLEFSVAVKPTPSISKSQQTIDLVKSKETNISIKGRHDPCIVPRILPVLEAITAFIICDMLLEEGYISGNHK